MAKLARAAMIRTRRVASSSYSDDVGGLSESEEAASLTRISIFEAICTMFETRMDHIESEQELLALSGVMEHICRRTGLQFREGANSGAVARPGVP